LFDVFRAKAIDNDQFAALTNLIDQGNRQVAKIFFNYEENKDVYALIDALKDLDVFSVSYTVRFRVSVLHFLLLS
jgi:hypothetical protein